MQKKASPPAPADKHAKEQQVLANVQHAAKEATTKLEAAGKAAHEAAVKVEQKVVKGVGAAAAAAGQAAKNTAESVGQKASSAVAGVKEGVSAAKQQLHGASDAASDKARTWFDYVQVCMGSLQILLCGHGVHGVRMCGSKYARRACKHGLSNRQRGELRMHVWVGRCAPNKCKEGLDKQIM